MTSKYDGRYPEGIDWSWGAVDREGYVGLFVTAGFGPIPAEYFAGEFSLDDSAEDLMQLLPETSALTLLDSMPNPSSITRTAAGGVFVYDWQDLTRRSPKTNEYDLIALPSKPIKVDQCPDDLQRLLKTRFRDTSFAIEKSIGIEARVPCCIGKWMR